MITTRTHIKKFLSKILITKGHKKTYTNKRYNTINHKKKIKIIIIKRNKTMKMILKLMQQIITTKNKRKNQQRTEQVAKAGFLKNQQNQNLIFPKTLIGKNRLNWLKRHIEKKWRNSNDKRKSYNNFKEKNKTNKMSTYKIKTLSLKRRDSKLLIINNNFSNHNKQMIE